MSGGSTREQRSMDKRCAIIAAAVQEFQDNGFLETSMDRIAETANVSKRTVYNHFPSKDILFQAIITELTENSGRLELPAPSDAPLKEQLLVVAASYEEMMASENFNKLCRVVLSRVIQSPDFAGSAITGRELNQPIQDWLVSAQKMGILPEFDTVQATSEFAGLISSMFFWPQVIANEKRPTKAVRNRYLVSIVEMFIKHYAPEHI